MSEKKVIISDAAPKAIGPYSQAILINGVLYSSGQIAIDPEKGTLVEGDAIMQAKQVFGNLENILRSAEMNFSNVVKITLYLSDLKDFQKVNSVFSEIFKENPPARETIQAAGLPLNSLVEISLIATK